MKNHTDVLIFYHPLKEDWLFVSERKQIALMAEEKIAYAISLRLFAINRSEMRITMKFFHLSDFHFGKILCGYDLVEEQRESIHQIAALAKKEKPDAIVVAGDIYDRSVPSASAMKLLEEFFLEIESVSAQEKAIEIILIAGNHDSSQRLSYGSSFLARHHIHMATSPPQEAGEKLQKITLSDVYGNVHFYLLPYTRPGMLRHLPGGEKVQSTHDAIRFLLDREEIDESERNVLISHQFYAAAGKEPLQSDSETPRLYVGGLDVVDTALVENFDYVALGHIHRPQNIGKKHIRYCGTPYPYSVSEAEQEKSVTVVEMGKKNQLSCRCIPLSPHRKVRRLYGTLRELSEGEEICSDYVSITLTDEEIPEHPKEYLEHFYEYILEIQVDNVKSRKLLTDEMLSFQETTPLEAFRNFFAESMGRQMSQAEEEMLQRILQETEGGVS